MASDNSPPRTLPIAITALVAVLVLAGLKPVFDSYYTEMFEAEAFRKVGGVEPTALLALHSAEAKGFAAAPVPLAKAMEMVAQNRAVPGIVPEQSTDNASLVGWAQLPKTGLGSLPPPPSSSAAPSPMGAPATSGSAAPMGAPATSGSAGPMTPPATSASGAKPANAPPPPAPAPPH